MPDLGPLGLLPSSGAFGFRDQLQDSLALLTSALASCASICCTPRRGQFAEETCSTGGTSQVARARTRFSDDRLWLVYATLQYIGATGTTRSRRARELYHGARLNPDEHEIYERPGIANEKASLYEHCIRAIGVSLSTGFHGLPRWAPATGIRHEPGRRRRQGRERWLGWFLVSSCGPSRISRNSAATAIGPTNTGGMPRPWSRPSRRRGTAMVPPRVLRTMDALGSKQNPECQIDAIAQSWAVLSGAGDPARARHAMAAVEGSSSAATRGSFSS